MPTEIYTRVVDDEGNISYTLLENPLSAIEDSLFYQDSRYKSVVAESVKRRKHIDELEAKFAEAQKPEPIAPVTEPPAPAPTLEEILAEFEKRQAVKQGEAQTRQQKLKSLLEQHKLPESIMPVLEASTDPETVAQLLGREKLVFEPTTGGETQATTQIPDLIAAAKAELGLK